MSYPGNSDSVSGDQLRAFIERIERMQEERKAIGDDIADIYREAKGNGFDTKVIKKIVADRAKDHNELLEFEAVYELYVSALGTAFANARAGAGEADL
jgi:uncharacterized protein (UPF0335 family)